MIAGPTAPGLLLYWSFTVTTQAGQSFLSAFFIPLKAFNTAVYRTKANYYFATKEIMYNKQQPMHLKDTECYDSPKQ